MTKKRNETQQMQQRQQSCGSRNRIRPSRWSGRGTAGLVVVGGLLALLILSAPGRGTAAVLSSSSHRRNSTTQQTVDGDVLDDPNCIDDHPDQCPAAADRGECQTLHASTRPVCRKSCWRCVNATELRLEGIGDDEIVRRYKYSRIDFGPLPSFPPHPNPRPVVLLTQDIMVAMDVYARQCPSLSCINNRSECPYWTATGYCDLSSTHWDYMMEECPLACRFCDQRAAYQQCHHLVQERQAPYHQVGPKPLLQEMRKWKHRLLKSFPSKQSANVLESLLPKDDPYQWAIRINDFMSRDERDTLTKLAKGLSWKPSSSYGYDLNVTLSLEAQTNYRRKQRVRRTSRSSQCSRDCIKQLPALQVVLKRLCAAMRVPLNLLEKPVEFVSHGPTDTFAKHSHCRMHDQWKVGGYRVATAYLALGGDTDNSRNLTNDDGDGDAPLYLGFPEWWEMVEVRPSQAMVWPNVRPSTTNDPGESEGGIACNGLLTEILAAPGTSYGILVHVRLYPHDEVLPAPCRT